MLAEDCSSNVDELALRADHISSQAPHRGRPLPPSPRNRPWLPQPSHPLPDDRQTLQLFQLHFFNCTFQWQFLLGPWQAVHLQPMSPPLPSPGDPARYHHRLSPPEQHHGGEGPLPTHGRNEDPSPPPSGPLPCLWRDTGGYLHHRATTNQARPQGASN